MTPLIQLRGVSKDFRGVLAISNVDFEIRPGEIHAILGENGAGKSTLMKVLAGVYQPSSGEMLLDGQPASLNSPSDALNRGIAMVFQETNLVPSMSVAQKRHAKCSASTRTRFTRSASRSPPNGGSTAPPGCGYCRRRVDAGQRPRCCGKLMGGRSP